MKLLYGDDFQTVDNWYTEGLDTVYPDGNGAMRIECIGSKQGGIGCHAFCKLDFPDNIIIEYNLLVSESNGLVITFIGMRGLGGEDLIDDLPRREGYFRDYVGEDAKVRSYHVSVSRYDDDGVHTGVCNWRRNPGIHLVGQGEDLCKKIGVKYAIRIEKRGPSCSLLVNGNAGPAFTDPDELPDEIPGPGKVGFRAIGSRVIAEVSQFRIFQAD